ncbi:MAG: hypothetical protein RJA57_1350 [Bacteroidota bacterium]|jgi:hypothetical protein
MGYIQRMRVCHFFLCLSILIALHARSGDKIPYLLKTGKYILVDRDTKERVKMNAFESIEFFKASEVSAEISKRFFIVVGSDQKRGVIDSMGQLVIPARFTDLKPVERSEGDILFITSDFNLSAGWTYGLIDLSGKELLPLQYESVRFLGDENLFFLKDKSGNSSIFDADRNVRVKFELQVIEYLGEGLFKYRKPISEYVFFTGLCNIQGKAVTPPIYVDIEAFHEGLAVVMGGSQKLLYGVIDTNGKLIIPVKFSERIGNFKFGSAPLIADKKTINYISRSGQLLLSKFKNAANKIKFISKNRMLFLNISTGKWGLLDAKENEIIPGKFDAILELDDQLLFAKNGSENLLIDHTGKEIGRVSGLFDPTIFTDEYYSDDHEVRSDISGFLRKDEILPFVQDKKIGFALLNGQVVHEAKYSHVQIIEKLGYVICVERDSKNRTEGFVSMSGKLISDLSPVHYSFANSATDVIKCEMSVGGESRIMYMDMDGYRYSDF